MSDVFDSEEYQRAQRLELLIKDIQAILGYRSANILLQQKIVDLKREHERKISEHGSTCYALQLKLQAKDAEIARLTHEKAQAITEMRYARDKAGKQVVKMRETVEFMRKWHNEEEDE